MKSVDEEDIKEIEASGYCPEADPSLDPEVIALRKHVQDALFGKNKAKKIKAAHILQDKYGMISFYREGYGKVIIQEVINNAKEK